MSYRISAVVGGALLALGIDVAPVAAAEPDPPAAVAAASSAPVQVTPAEIDIGLFYSGHDLEVRAEAPAGVDLVFRLSGPSEPLTLKKKGRKYGFLWMNVGEVEFPALPGVYLLRSTRPLPDLAPVAERLSLGLGYDALEASLPEGDTEPRELFGELIELKEHDDLYSSRVGGVEVTADGAVQQATARLFLPAKAPVGDYQVEVFAFRDGRVEPVGSAGIHLQRGREVAFLTDMVKDRGLLYGCLAVIIAIFAGLGTGLVFGKGGAH